MYIPVCFKPEADELLYSWLLRLAQANGFCGYNAEYSFTDYYMKKILPQHVCYANARHLDYMPALETVCSRYKEMKCFPTLETIVSRMTPLYVWFPLLPWRQQVKRSELLFRDRIGIYESLCDRVADIHELKVCPECMKEDQRNRGEAYYHTWHHLPAVSICAKHKIPLMKVRIKNNEYLNRKEVISTLEPVRMRAPEQTELKISGFMKGMYDEPVNIDWNITQLLLLERMEERGYPLIKPFGNLVSDMKDAGYGELLGDKPESKISACLNSKIRSVTVGVCLLSFLFEDYEDFQQKTENHGEGWKKNFREEIKYSYEFRSPFGQTVLLKCRQCGYEFYTHPYAILMGSGCPECEKQLLEEQLLNRRLRFLGDGQYEVITDGAGKVEGVLHKTCGKIRKINALTAVYEEKECVCGFRLSEEEIQNRIDPTKSKYTLIQYGNRKTTQNVIIHHKECGRTFKIGLVKFEKAPYCRCCFPQKHTAEIFERRIQELTGDEYEVILPFVSQKKKVKLRHKLCGTVTSGYPVEFLNGRRCDLCTPLLSEKMVTDMINEAIGGVCKVENKEQSVMTVRKPDGTVFRKPAKYIVQECTRPTPSELFPERVKIMPQFVSEKGKLYLEICDATTKKEKWKLASRHEQGKERIIIKNYIHWLVKNGYIEHIGSGTYRSIEKE